MFPDQQHCGTCWPGVCTVPHEMLICTLAFLWVQLPWTKRKSLLYNSEIYWEWNTRTPGVEHCNLCKQSKACMRLEKQRPVRESKKREEERKNQRKTKWTPLSSWKPPLNNPGFLIMKQTFFVQAWWNSFFCGNLATCYSLCDTNILHYVLRRFRYWTPVE